MFDILRIEPSGRRVRAFVGGTPVADSNRVLMVWEPKRLPVYHFPIQDVRSELLRPSERLENRWDIEGEGRRSGDAAWASGHPPVQAPAAFRGQRRGAWCEEADEGVGHPRDGYHRAPAPPGGRRA